MREENHDYPDDYSENQDSKDDNLNDSDLNTYFEGEQLIDVQQEISFDQKDNKQNSKHILILLSVVVIIIFLIIVTNLLSVDRIQLSHFFFQGGKVKIKKSQNLLKLSFDPFSFGS